ncbi:hypothetical protein L2E82_12591 [Cichorium intybus]|uniref:Uncharacterized protein n=1 Tax=Cichorium intybus TaxID=13427 RepID=A0ACB9GH48_CICIN|nr:hypothetical protein L2E82_12591 [Cichorium intybus]
MLLFYFSQIGISKAQETWFWKCFLLTLSITRVERDFEEKYESLNNGQRVYYFGCERLREHHLLIKQKESGNVQILEKGKELLIDDSHLTQISRITRDDVYQGDGQEAGAEEKIFVPMRVRPSNGNYTVDFVDELLCF